MVRSDPHGLHARDRFPEGAREVGVRGRELVGELVVPAFERCIAFGNQDALVRVADSFHVDAQPEAVEQLGPKLALLRVHGADEDEARGVAERHALTLDHVDAHRRCVQQHVDKVIVEKVHLVHVEDVAVSLGEDARLELLGP